MQTIKVKINGTENELTLVFINRNNTFQYNTIGNKSAHTFNIDLSSLKKGSKFKTSGNNYEII